MSEPLSDKEILNKIRKGGRELEEVTKYIYQQTSYKKEILDFLQKRKASLEDAQDIFQDGIHHLIINIRDHRFEGKSSLKTYLYSICKNLWFSKLSKNTRHREIQNKVIDTTEGHNENPERLLLMEEKQRLLQDVLKKLGEGCKEILGFWSLGYSMKEIQEKTGYKSENVIRQKKHRCMKQLTVFLKEKPELIKALIP